MSKIKEILINRDGMSEDEAEELIGVAKDQLRVYLDNGDVDLAEDVCSEYFGLEPDYLFELLD